jgi:hypothetical protein
LIQKYEESQTPSRHPSRVSAVEAPIGKEGGTSGNHDPWTHQSTQHPSDVNILSDMLGTPRRSASKNVFEESISLSFHPVARSPFCTLQQRWVPRTPQPTKSKGLTSEPFADVDIGSGCFAATGTSDKDENNLCAEDKWVQERASLRAALAAALADRDSALEDSEKVMI